ncbi:MAG: hypothetical protein HPY79_10535 [Bacteroidales bacterium]|nr:hypothetical protein [Bacteroidales bacterium]
MKILEKILIALFILSILLKAFNINYSDVFFIICLSMLALHYFPFSIYTIINIKTQPQLLNYSLFYGFVLSFGLVVILLNILKPLPYGTFGINQFLSITAIVLLIISLLSSFIKFKKLISQQLPDNRFFYYIIYRCLVLIILIILAYLPSTHS